MNVRLYSIPGSHPVATVEAMLRYKGIPYKRRDLVTFVAKPILRVMGFPKGTVPAMKIDGRKVQGSREIAVELERIKPDPPLFPGDTEKRSAVLEAERWGDEEFQHPVRQIALWAIKNSRPAQRSYLEGTKLGLPTGVAAATAPPIITVYARYHGASDEVVRDNLARLGGMLEKIDAWIAAGVLDGEQLNAADFQIAPTLRLAMSLQDLRASIDGRPAGRLARRAIPDFNGDTPPVLPAAWLEPLNSLAAA